VKWYCSKHWIFLLYILQFEENTFSWYCTLSVHPWTDVIFAVSFFILVKKKFYFTEWYLLENAVSPTLETYFSTPRYCQTLLCIHLVLFVSSFSTPYKPRNFSERIGVCTYFEKYLHSMQNSILSHNHRHFLSPLCNLLLIFWWVVSSVTYTECNNACLHTQQCMEKLKV